MEMNALRPLDAVVAGYLGVDIAPGFARQGAISFTELFRPGKLIETEGLHFSLGGVVANTGLAMRKFGCNAALMGCVGDDALGQLALAQLAQLGVTQGIRQTGETGTAYGIVIAPPGTDRVFLEDPGCNRVFNAADIDYDLTGQSRIFHFGYPPLMQSLWTNKAAELVKMFERVRRQGTVISLDMTLPDPDAPAGKADWRKILYHALPLVDIFVPSIEELLFMLAPQRYSAIARQAVGGNMPEFIPETEYVQLAGEVLAMGVKILLVKAGNQGAFLITGNLAELNSSPLRLNNSSECPRGIWLPPFPVDAGPFRNASGAGDCAVAAFLTALLNAEDVVTAGKYAMIAGRDNLYGQDALSGLRDWVKMSEDLNSVCNKEQLSNCRN
ncbi:MAG: carbohydrate kinase family protein [Victivallales bacterium]|nr:carbohydrate kinase family protein [Victivallales bacterium]